MAATKTVLTSSQVTTVNMTHGSAASSSRHAFALFTAETAAFAGNKPAYAESTAEVGYASDYANRGVLLHVLATGKRAVCPAHQRYIRVYSVLVKLQMMAGIREASEKRPSLARTCNWRFRMEPLPRRYGRDSGNRNPGKCDTTCSKVYPPSAPRPPSSSST